MTRSARDRTRRVALLGVLASCCGAGGAVLGVLHLGLPFVPSASSDWRMAWMGFLTWLPLGIVLGWSGIAAVRLRRWSRPVLLTVGWTWLIAGAVATCWVAWTAADLVVLATATLESPPPPDVLSAVQAVIVGGVLVAGVAAPAVLVWGLSGADVRTTLARHDPAPAWTDACPLPVLALSLGLWLAALVAVPLALHPAVPLFGVLVTGPAGAALILAGAAAAVGLGWLTYRLRPAGLWGTAAAVVGLGVSTAWTLGRVDVLDVYRAVGYPPEYVDAMRASALARPAPLIVATLVLTALSLAYLLAVRRHVVAGPARADRADRPPTPRRAGDVRRG